ncbi:MAG: exodeoxyribonuclease III [Deltaproteobacteria bacterium]|nr:MAG: exodeoxyribonuclease III [Deltaproteobacteria bacterium]
MSFSIATWNVNSLRVRLEQVQRWSQEHRPDVLCLQETKVIDKKFPHEALAEVGYAHRAIYGQKTYNGVAILSRHPLAEVHEGFALGEPDPQTRLLRATTGGIRIFCCYVPNGGQVGSEKFSYKLDWLSRLREELDADRPATEPVVVCGDFNIAPADQDVWDPFEAENEILFHPLEHQALDKVRGYGLHDALRELHPVGKHFSWWDYRGGAFRRNHGYRIDHHWVSDGLKARVSQVETHRDVRGWEQPSDHVPVVVHLKE